MFNHSRRWEDECLDDKWWLGEDDLAVYASSNDAEQGPPFTSTRKRLGISYYTTAFQRPPFAAVCVLSLIVNFITVPLQLWLRSL